MLEIEKKILEIPKRRVIQKLKQLKAKKILSAFIRVKFFDYPDHRIHKERNLLRLREFREGRKRTTELTYKTHRGVKGGAKWFDELEIEIPGSDTWDNMCEFFKRLGFEQTLYYEKKRTLFSLPPWKFELDEHPRIPPLLEIEGKNPKAIERAIKLLSLEGFEVSAETIEELMGRKYPQVPLNGLRFR